jgi:hypothetical protein
MRLGYEREWEGAEPPARGGPRTGLPLGLWQLPECPPAPPSSVLLAAPGAGHKCCGAVMVVWRQPNCCVVLMAPACRAETGSAARHHAMTRCAGRKRAGFALRGAANTAYQSYGAVRYIRLCASRRGPVARGARKDGEGEGWRGRGP